MRCAISGPTLLAGILLAQFRLLAAVVVLARLASAEIPSSAVAQRDFQGILRPVDQFARLFSSWSIVALIGWGWQEKKMWFPGSGAGC